MGLPRDNSKHLFDSRKLTPRCFAVCSGLRARQKNLCAERAARPGVSLRPTVASLPETGPRALTIESYLHLRNGGRCISGNASVAGGGLGVAAQSGGTGPVPRVSERAAPTTLGVSPSQTSTLSPPATDALPGSTVRGVEIDVFGARVLGCLCRVPAQSGDRVPGAPPWSPIRPMQGIREFRGVSFQVKT